MLKNKIKKSFIALILTIIVSLVLFSVYSCKKEVTPGNYVLGEPTTDTTTWQWQYTYSGILPNWGNGSINNELVNTKWVIRRYNIGGFNMTYPDDTLFFINNTNYLINGFQASFQTYQITNITGSTNKSLTLNFLQTFGGSNYSGQVGQFFVTQGLSSEIPIVFNDMQSNITLNSWLSRIQ
jgi:hypothetical protein